MRSKGKDWKVWTITVVGTDTKYNQLVTISTKTAKEWKTKPRCFGHLAVRRSDKCNDTECSRLVSIHPRNKSVWKLRKVNNSTNIYIIEAASRKLSCKRFLGASCLGPYVQMYTSANGLEGPHYVSTWHLKYDYLNIYHAALLTLLFSFFSKTAVENTSSWGSGR